MKLTILGSGTYQPELERHSSSYLVEVGKSKVCFDFGRGAIDQLLKIGMHINEIEAVFISHWHADHINDIVSLLHVTTAPPADFGVADSWPRRHEPLKIFGPKGTRENIGILLTMIMQDPDPNFNHLEIKELANDEIKLSGMKIKSYLIKHNQETTALAYRLEAENKVFAYSGDTVESEGLARAISNADLAVVEAGWPDEVQPKTHFTGKRAGKFAEENGVKKLIITHMAPLYLQRYDPKSDTEKYFKREVILAKDLLKIEI